jgi:hypothetical protein
LILRGRGAPDPQPSVADLVPEWSPPEDEAGWTAWLEQGGFVPVTAVRLFQVDAAPAGVGPSTDAGGDGGTYLTLPAAVALGIAGWATAGSLLLAIRRYRRPTRTHVVVAVMTGLVSAAFVGILAGLAISQAHSPF